MVVTRIIESAGAGNITMGQKTIDMPVLRRRDWKERNGIVSYIKLRRKYFLNENIMPPASKLQMVNYIFKNYKNKILCVSDTDT